MLEQFLKDSMHERDPTLEQRKSVRKEKQRGEVMSFDCLLPTSPILLGLEGEVEQFGMKE